ncbi:hypothetical protein [Actinomadura rupiterrae]|uniref:hypothetical protein n=1 Tax=Actinomadura rupiterrae TaxID=559627 RepID=UPI0020A3E8E0|nr:hypothetical protein [Actinomadura rupiterrae]MCP2337421.1 hypothetical protein [Actinomadura rupiterrae]
MRLRTAAAVTAGSVSILFAASGVANAAMGGFSYKFVGLHGEPRSATLHNPASHHCITLPEVADPHASEPAFAPHNDTDERAVVYTGPHCSGDAWNLRAHGRPATDRLKLRSVYLTGEK